MKGADSIFQLLSPLDRLAYSLTPSQLHELTGLETDFMTFCIGEIDKESPSLLEFSEAIDFPRRNQALISLEDFSIDSLIQAAFKEGMTLDSSNGGNTGVIGETRYEIPHSLARRVIELSSQPTAKSNLVKVR